MTSAFNASRSGLIAGAAATLAVAAMGFAGAAQARDNVEFSLGIGVPGAQIGVSNAYPVYTQPQVVYTQPAPVYVQPQVVYSQPAPVYVQPQVVYSQPVPVYAQPAPAYYPRGAVYVAPQPVYYGRPHGWRGHHDGRFVQAPGYGPGYRPGYAPVYYQR